jgi:hypothetical protein
VEICNNNVWGTVCDDFWGTPDVQVVCRQLGFASEGILQLCSGMKIAACHPTLADQKHQMSGQRLTCQDKISEQIKVTSVLVG